jgi:hypothetical protein
MIPARLNFSFGLPENGTGLIFLTEVTSFISHFCDSLNFKNCPSSILSLWFFGQQLL